MHESIFLIFSLNRTFKKKKNNILLFFLLKKNFYDNMFKNLKLFFFLCKKMYKKLEKAYPNLESIHKEIINVDMRDEIEEQKLIFEYLDRNSKGVLEFGGNIGRSSIVINKLLNNPERHVVFESDPKNAKILELNKKNNNCLFHIIEGALSNYPLVQQDWNTKIDDGNSNPMEWKKINTISFKEFKQLYPLDFDTLVIDCEGCIVQILKDNGNDILESIKTIIIEHDDRFNCNVEQNFARPYILSKGFKSVISKDLGEYKCFYEVLKRE